MRTKLAAKKSAKTKTTNHDVTEYLHTPEKRPPTDAWLEERPEDVAGIARALGDIARAKGMPPMAKDACLSREGLYRALSAEGKSQLCHRAQRSQSAWHQAVCAGCDGWRSTLE